MADRDYWPSGRLVLEIDRDGRTGGLRRRFSDGKREEDLRKALAPQRLGELLEDHAIMDDSTEIGSWLPVWERRAR